MKKYRAGVIGVGFIGVAHIEQLRRMGCVDVVAIADSEDAQEKADGLFVPVGYADYRDMIANENLDVVHICTPNYLHYDMAMAAFDSGCNVVCEKPMCKDMDEAEKMVKKAKIKGLLNGINYQYRQFPMVVELRQMVETGELGRIHSVNGEFLQDWLLLDTDFNWRVVSGESGKTRVVSDIGTHWMDLVENVTGLRITEVFADFIRIHDVRKKATGPVRTFKNAREGANHEKVDVDTEDHANILFRFNNGAVGSLVASQVAAGRKARLYVNIAGAGASAAWDSDHCNELWIGKRTGRNQIFDKDPALMTGQGAGACWFPGGHPEGFPDALRNNLEAMYKTLDGKSAPVGFATFENGLRELKLCDAIWKSAQKGEWVAVDDGN
jgi:predicted dehydrogenase